MTGRVAIVCEKLAAGSGGAERVLVDLGNALSERGHRVELISYEATDDEPYISPGPGVSHMNLFTGGGANPAGWLQRLRSRVAKPSTLAFPVDRLVWRTRYRGFSQRVASYIDDARPDVVVAFMPPAIIATALAGTSDRPRLVASTHNAPEQDFENPDRWDPGAYARRRRVELMDRMDAITVLLPAYRDWYPPHLRDKTVVVPNPVAPVRQPAGEREPALLAVGRLAAAKRHDLTIRAFFELADEFRNWRLDIFGVGPLEAELRSLVAELGLDERARIRGHTLDIATEYLRARILCHPAQFEGFPLAVTEALASGLPVVGFADCTGVNSLVVDGENGRLLDPGDGSDAARVSMLVTALRDLMSDDRTRSALAGNGPRSMEPFRPDRVYDQWEDVLFPRDAVATSSSDSTHSK